MKFLIIKLGEYTMKNNLLKRTAAVTAAAAISVSAFGLSASAQQDENLLIGALKKGAAFIGSSEGDFGYEGTLKISFDKLLTEGLLEEPLKDITADISAARNGELGAAGIKLVYGEGSLCTIEVISDDASGKYFIRIPELSEEYLSFDGSELFPDDDNEDEDENWEDVTDSAMVAADITSVDWQALLSSLSDYGELVYSKLGAGEVGEFECEIKDVSYDLSSISYTLDDAQMSELITQISEAAQNDENMQAFVELRGYDSLEDMLTYAVWGEEEANDGAVYTLTLISDGDKLCGAEISSEAEKSSFIVIPDEEGVSAQFSVAETYSEEYSLTQTDAIILKNDEDGKINAEIYNKIDQGDYYSYTDLIIENALITENSVSGSITYINGDSDGAYTEIKAQGDISDESQNIQAQLSDGEVSLIKASYSGSVTDIPEIAIPEKSYDVNNEDELAEYLASADTEGFVENAKNVLGNELYELIIDALNFGGENPPTDDTSSANDSSSSESSVTVSSTGASAPKVSSNNADPSPETGSAAVGAASLVFIAAAIAVKKRK